ncbi:hypothetical protein TspCOW1_08510 [Thiohalobacter sp. COW1]|uniref:Phosphodiesterase n=1 Tax=Thiohalobacter thiocyanaticus TaxID=585455 RepID=A0A1Z4VS69_9GAMM|nr:MULTISPECIES: hypothetical protein [Thiohalobacter]BAZ94188.1 uncharacterized protein FOKN1_1802 [Thiohalobacter thiocyanaticus]BCO30748.1 hypothetical protein TspCOW1_08510 [Thiohalobacter sp. COW1]
MYRFSPLFAILALTLLALPARAEVLLIKAVEESASVQTPSRSSSMDSVRSRFGAPREAHAAIGEPPITRWDYPDFTVYFEHDRVIHAVVHRDQP